VDELLRVCRYEAEEDANLVGVRGTKANRVDGEHTLFGFLTTAANDMVGAVHPKAMPLILTNSADIETWMTAPPDEALRLQRPLPAGELRIVARGDRQDEPLESA
jgi:putative SOS response-associated peptidase YedK